MGTKIYRYGEAGADVRARASLLNDYADVGALTVAGTTARNEKGYLPDGTNNLMIAPVTATDLEQGGQMTIELETERICASTDEGGAAAAAGNEYILTARPAAGGVVKSRFRRNPVNQMVCELAVGDTAATVNVSKFNKPEMARMTVAWDTNEMRTYINGDLITIRSTAVETIAGIFENIYLGTNLGAGTDFFNGAMRNFQITADDVTMPASLGTVAVFGDSLAMGSFIDFDAAQGGQTDGTIVGAIRGYLNLIYGKDCEFSNKGNPNELDGWGHSGHGISDTHSDPLSDHRAAMLASAPDYVVLMAGTNDCNSALTDKPATDFASSLRSHIDAIMATASVNGLVVVAPPALSANSTFNVSNVRHKLKVVNNLMMQVVAEWNDENPLKRGRVVFIDGLVATGNYNYPDNAFMGDVTGNLDDLHPSSKGRGLITDAIAPVMAGMMTGQRLETFSGPRSVAAAGILDLSRPPHWRL